jgi:hypothetical protein
MTTLEDMSEESVGQATADPACAMPSNRALTIEVWIVLLLSIAATGLRSLLSLIDALTKNVPLSNQTASNVSSVTPDRPWLDLAFQLTGIALALVPVALVFYLLYRSGESARVIGFDLTQPGKDIVRGLILAAVVGIAGLALYLTAYRMGANVRLASVNLTGQWWTIPVLLLSAAENAILEEVIVLAYLLHRLKQLGWKPAQAIGASALLRGSYHLYQGFGGFVGNLGMGVIFGWLYTRWNRVMPFIIAHFVIDAVAFIGYSSLHGKVAWLP